MNLKYLPPLSEVFEIYQTETFTLIVIKFSQGKSLYKKIHRELECPWSGRYGTLKLQSNKHRYYVRPSMSNEKSHDDLSIFLLDLCEVSQLFGIPN